VKPLPNWMLLLATGACLGAGMPLARVAYAHGVAPLSFALWPTLFAGIALASIAYWRNGMPRSREQRGQLARFGIIAGLLGQALPLTATYQLSVQAGAGFSALAYTLPPVFTLLIGLLAGLERWQTRRAAAVLLGLAGAGLLTLARFQIGDVSPATLLLIFAIPAFVGAGNVYRAMHLPRAAANEWLGAAMLLGSAAVLLPVDLVAGHGIVFITFLGWACVALQMLIQIGGYLLYFALQRRAEPVTFSFLGYAMTLTGVLAGAILFGERLPWQIAPAVFLIALGFALVLRSRTIPASAHQRAS